ncbi:SMC-Scp complex subunit ScpB [Streptomyces spiramenti]|uniref:SMC-Scp complex subunit ScpB n=1 Tax=Streptomyces spiramenti TaxID=2720606 RepID=A0ABX1AVT2_9ACTN|nr:SMC-Scp complex subunit ScpB [Streptomyces spiramenti]NJP69135.1 SMC-Scp complex subunit ScpB [Streptomyces spiramenti]
MTTSDTPAPAADPGGPVPVPVPAARPSSAAPADGDVIPDTQDRAPGDAAVGSAAGPEPAPAAELPLRPALEAVLMVVDEPVREEHLARTLDRPRQEIADALHALAREYEAEGRGFDLRFVAEGWRFYTRTAYADAVERFVLDGRTARLTQAALETLAVVAYRQPVSRSRVAAVRGVNCDGVMRSLLQRGLLEEAGAEPGTGAILYRTTHYFLERLGLRGLDELPELAPFLPEADAVEPDSQEAVPTFDVDSADPPT